MRRVLAVILALAAVVLGPHMFLMLSLAVALAVVLGFAWRIDQLTLATGWRIVPVRAVRAPLAVASW